MQKLTKFSIYGAATTAALIAIASALPLQNTIAVPIDLSPVVSLDGAKLNMKADTGLFMLGAIQTGGKSRCAVLPEGKPSANIAINGFDGSYTAYGNPGLVPVAVSVKQTVWGGGLRQETAFTFRGETLHWLGPVVTVAGQETIRVSFAIPTQIKNTESGSTITASVLSETWEVRHGDRTACLYLTPATARAPRPGNS